MATAKETIRRKGTVETLIHVFMSINVCLANKLKGGVAAFMVKSETWIQTMYCIYR